MGLIECFCSIIGVDTLMKTVIPECSGPFLMVHTLVYIGTLEKFNTTTTKKKGEVNYIHSSNLLFGDEIFMVSIMR